MDRTTLPDGTQAEVFHAEVSSIRKHGGGQGYVVSFEASGEVILTIRRDQPLPLGATFDITLKYAPPCGELEPIPEKLDWSEAMNKSGGELEPIAE